MQQVDAMLNRVADCDAPVLVTGESGVGKEVIARELHRRSPRRERPFLKVNCAALPKDLLESELFGHEKGAFTGAETTTAGKFEAADRGTLMLDEIGEMPATLQAKLLHVLEDGHFSKLGSNREITLDVRVIAATNRVLSSMLAEGHFREDLYYRLQVIEIHVPPLRERREEIEPLATAFLAAAAHREGRAAPPLSPRLLDELMRYDWPGNVRELENVMQRYVILHDETLVLRELRHATAGDDRTATPMPIHVEATGDVIDEPPESASDDERSEPLPELVRRATDRVEREVISRALSVVRWNRRRAARLLGVSYKTLLNKMRLLGLDRAEQEESTLAD